MSRSLYRYQSVARDSSALLVRIKEITAMRVHYGYRRVHMVLQREGWRDNCKRVYGLYRAEGLPLRHRRLAIEVGQSLKPLISTSCFSLCDRTRFYTASAMTGHSPSRSDGHLHVRSTSEAVIGEKWDERPLIGERHRPRLTVIFEYFSRTSI